MIIKREENNGIVEAMYDSSNILSSLYDTNSNSLIIIFKNGGKYRYPNVSKSDYMRFEIAESQGVVFNTHIKKYSFEKLDNIDLEVLMNKIKESKQLLSEEKNAQLLVKRKTLLAKTKQISSFNDDVLNEVLINELTNLKKLIDEYINFETGV